MRVACWVLYVVVSVPLIVCMFVCSFVCLFVCLLVCAVDSIEALLYEPSGNQVDGLPLVLHRSSFDSQSNTRAVVLGPPLRSALFGDN